MTALRSFSEWAAEYSGFDYPSLIAEAATLDETEPFNRLAAMFVQMMEVIGNSDLSPEERFGALRLVIAVQHDLERATVSDLGARQRFDLAREATFDRLVRFSAYPECVKLARPGIE